MFQDPKERAGFSELQDLKLFEEVDWVGLPMEEAPFLPQPDDETDTAYFDARNKLQQWKISQIVDDL